MVPIAVVGPASRLCVAAAARRRSMVPIAVVGPASGFHVAAAASAAANAGSRALGQLVAAVLMRRFPVLALARLGAVARLVAAAALVGRVGLGA